MHYTHLPPEPDEKVSRIEILDRLRQANKLVEKYRNLLIIAEERIDELESKRTWWDKVVRYGKKYW